jgi:hypothetical protein
MLFVVFDLGPLTGYPLLQAPHRLFPQLEWT